MDGNENVQQRNSDGKYVISLNARAFEMCILSKEKSLVAKCLC